MDDHAHRPASPSRGSRVRLLARAILTTVAAALVLGACSSADATPPPIDRPGTPGRPREVNIVAKDYLFVPSEVRFVPGETVLLHVVNGGLALHEVVIGDGAVQDAWEIAEAQTVGAPPGPTPVVVVPPGVEGLRVVVASGERRDVLYAVPAAGALVVGCHIPGHFAKGMHVPVRFVSPGAS
jgi:uncharacterized cupredoxin-like copper-binding protein